MGGTAKHIYVSLEGLGALKPTAGRHFQCLATESKSCTAASGCAKCMGGGS